MEKFNADKLIEEEVKKVRTFVLSYRTDDTDDPFYGKG